MFCRKCGKEIPAESKFCNNCGEMVFTEDIEPSELDESAFAFTPVAEIEPNGSAAVKKSASKKSKIVIISAIAAVITASAAAGLFILLNRNDGKKIADAFENTFGAESYKCTLTSYCLNDDGIEDEDPMEVYIEHFRNDDECLFYYKTDGESDNNYGENVRLAYENGDWYHGEKDEYLYIYETDKEKKNSKKFDKYVKKSPYHVLTTSNSYLEELMELRDNTGYLRFVMPASAAPQLKQMLKDYFEDSKSVDCIKEYENNGNKYSFKIDYGKMIKSLEVDYNKKVKNNVVELFSDFEDADKYKYTLTVDAAIKNEYVKKLDIDLYMEQKNGDRYAKIGKWTFEFDKVNKLKSENCKVYKIDKQTAKYSAERNAKTVYNLIAVDISDAEIQGYAYDEVIEEMLGEIDCNDPNNEGKAKEIADELNRLECNGIVYVGKYSDERGRFFVQWRENKDSDVIGQYPAPNNPEGNVIWGVYS